MEEDIKKAREIIENAKGVTVLTGAGVSAESGVPTFRGKEGLWEQYDPEKVDTAEAFHRDPEYVWGWYDEIRGLISEKEPNPGHYAIARLENIKSPFTLITQNIDDLHRVAGSTNIIELHGNIWWRKCTECSYVDENREVPLRKIPPECANCSAYLRPFVVWFRDNIPMPLIDSCLISIEDADVMIIVGTSSLVEPAASMGLVAKHTGKTVIEVNLEETPKSQKYDLSLRGKSGEILPQIVPQV